ncbi:MAG: CRISPR-associated protein Cas4 [Actinobacteria bacterium]|nr:CRISPR-associated protein Cas4 [Actinomycetota bacterium]
MSDPESVERERVSPESIFMITPSEVIEYLFCPRFIYFMNCLDIPQHEELRYKVLKGREMHKLRAKHNVAYLRKKLGCAGKEIDVYLASPRLHVRGVVDEVLHLADGTAAPLDYKFAECRWVPFKTHKMQSVLYAMLIRECYGKKVEKGYVCYLRGGSKVEEIVYREADFAEAESIISEIVDIIERGYYPGRARSRNRCADCCYRNICV